MSNHGFTLQQGCSVYHENVHYIVLQIVNLDYVLAEHFDDQVVHRLRISELSLKPNDNIRPQSAIDAIEDKDWQLAQQRLEIIQPLVNKAGRTAHDVKEVADKYELHINTLYKWLRLYEGDGLLSVLMPKKRSDSGKTKLSTDIEKVIDEQIHNEYLSKQRRSIAALHRLIELECRKLNLAPPHVNTVRNRVNKLSDELKIRKRFGNKIARDQFSISQGEFPHADYPLAVVQIDHTLIDIILVDDEYRQPIGRPWITLAIDVYSRMVTGFYISFDPPGAIAVGMCLANSILPKEKYLAGFDIDTSWPCWGVPRTIHADNAKEFRGNMLKKACAEYGVTLEWRPVARPHFGAHVERLLGTLSQQIHELPGTTFSNTRQREGYNSDKNAALTLKEFEKWLTILVVESYQQRMHAGINTTPYKMYESGILGTNNTKGIGLPKKIEDEETLKINFLPYVERTVQDYGIRIDDVFYYHDVLRVWVNSTVEGRSKLKRKFICRRDPRDSSKIWFYDPQLKQHFVIPYRNTSHPSMTVWELRAVQKQLKADGVVDINEDLIFEALDKMRELERQSVEKTKKHRKAIQKRNDATTATKEQHPKNKNTTQVLRQLDDDEHFDDDGDDILPFDEMEELRHD